MISLDSHVIDRDRAAGPRLNPGLHAAIVSLKHDPVRISSRWTSHGEIPTSFKRAAEFHGLAALLLLSHRERQNRNRGGYSETQSFHVQDYFIQYPTPPRNGDNEIGRAHV